MQDQNNRIRAARAPRAQTRARPAPPRQRATCPQSTMNLSENCTWNCEKLMKSGYEIQIFHLSTRLQSWELPVPLSPLVHQLFWTSPLPLNWWPLDRWTCCGHLATKEFHTLTITFWHLCIPLFYMIFLTIIYNWMCSWLYFFINLLCTIFPWTFAIFFVRLGWGGWDGRAIGGFLFIAFTNSILLFLCF